MRYAKMTARQKRRFWYDLGGFAIMGVCVLMTFALVEVVRLGPWT